MKFELNRFQRRICLKMLTDDVLMVSCYFVILFVILFCMFVGALLSPAGKGLTYWLFCM